MSQRSMALLGQSSASASTSAAVVVPRPYTIAISPPPWSPPPYSVRKKTAMVTLSRGRSSSDSSGQQQQALNRDKKKATPFSAAAVLKKLGVQIPDDLSTIEPIPSSTTKSGYYGVYPGRAGKAAGSGPRWQAQIHHEAIGGFASKWEAGVHVTARLAMMAAAEHTPEPAPEPAAASMALVAVADASSGAEEGAHACIRHHACTRGFNHSGRCGGMAPPRKVRLPACEEDEPKKRRRGRPPKKVEHDAEQMIEELED